MKFFIMLAGVGVAVMAFISMASLGPPPFDYDNATMEERQEWLDKQAAVFKKSARFFLPSGRGPSALNFFLDDVETDPAAKQMKLNIRVDVPYGASVSTPPQHKMMATMCKSYVKTALHREAVRMAVEFKSKKHGTLTRLTVSPSRCEMALANESA